MNDSIAVTTDTGLSAGTQATETKERWHYVHIESERFDVMVCGETVWHDRGEWASQEDAQAEGTGWCEACVIAQHEEDLAR